MTKVYLTILSSLLVSPLCHASGFDKSLHVLKKDLGKSPYRADLNAEMTCFYYPHFMVKSIDRGQKGADYISVVNIVKGEAKPPCQIEKIKNEHVLVGEENSHWTGYFLGVKGPYVFLDAEDGSNGSMSFAVFKGTFENPVFTDSYDGRINFTDAKQSGILYKRAITASCSIPDKGLPCEDEVLLDVKAKLKKGELGKICKRGYDEYFLRMAKAQCSHLKTKNCEKSTLAALKAQEVLSVVSFPVFVDFEKFSIEAKSGEINCWPAD